MDASTLHLRLSTPSLPFSLSWDHLAPKPRLPTFRPTRRKTPPQISGWTKKNLRLQDTSRSLVQPRFGVLSKPPSRSSPCTSFGFPFLPPNVNQRWSTPIRCPVSPSPRSRRVMDEGPYHTRSPYHLAPRSTSIPPSTRAQRPPPPLPPLPPRPNDPPPFVKPRSPRTDRSPRKPHLPNQERKRPRICGSGGRFWARTRSWGRRTSLSLRTALWTPFRLPVSPYFHFLLLLLSSSWLFSPVCSPRSTCLGNPSSFTVERSTRGSSSAHGRFESAAKGGEGEGKLGDGDREQDQEV